MREDSVTSIERAPEAVVAVARGLRLGHPMAPPNAPDTSFRESRIERARSRQADSVANRFLLRCDAARGVQWTAAIAVERVYEDADQRPREKSELGGHREADK